MGVTAAVQALPQVSAARMGGMSDPVVPPQAPPHPYAAMPSQPNAARGIAIVAMALGLAAIVTVLVAMFYLPVAMILGILLAVTGIVLGGVAVVRRGPRGPGITGLVSGGVAILLAVGMVAMGMGALSAQALLGFATHGGAAASGKLGEGAGPGSGGDQAPDPGAPTTVEWPANFATGGIMFTGDEDGVMRVIASDPLPDNSFPDISELPRAADGTAPDRIQVYLDYRCPACLNFELANGGTLERAARAGAVVELQPLTFLDGASAGTYYSSRVSGAMACLAEHQPAAAWGGHVALLSPDFQPAGGTAGPDNAAIIERIEGATGPLDSDARSCIAEEQHVVFAQALSNWISTNPVPRAEIPDLRVEGTPLVLVNGVGFAGDISDPSAFAKFLGQQQVPLAK